MIQTIYVAHVVQTYVMCLCIYSRVSMRRCPALCFQRWTCVILTTQWTSWPPTTSTSCLTAQRLLWPVGWWTTTWTTSWWKCSARGWGEGNGRNLMPWWKEDMRLLFCFLDTISSPCLFPVVWGGLPGAGPGQCCGLGRDVPRWGVHLWGFHRASVGLPHHPAATGEEVSLSNFTQTATSMT